MSGVNHSNPAPIPHPHRVPMLQIASAMPPPPMVEALFYGRNMEVAPDLVEGNSQPP
jgi:hypothetical protein